MTNHRYAITSTYKGEVSTYTLVSTEEGALEAAHLTATTGGSSVVVRRAWGDRRVVADLG
jgi:hypothetical protein